MIKPFKNNDNLLLSIISITFIIAIFVCVLCDGILNKTLTWSLYPAASCIFAWLTLLPVIKLKKHKVIAAMCVFSLLVIPFLFLVEYACPVKGWVIPLGVPVSAASIAFLWTSGFLFVKTKLRIWYKVSVITLLAVPASYFTNVWVDGFLQQTNTFSTILNAVSAICLALAFFFVGYASKKKESAPDKPIV